MMMDFGFIPQGEHMYTLGATGLDNVDYVYDSRIKAKKRMYDLMGKYDLQIVDKYDDHHFKTYICTKGVKFYINRVC